ncbi:hypothetical protein RRG08_029305 [Elysia crispata]|uniref:SCAN box domain-containing protein n=1 Tax=Elysia crispata TaxID=231223 RepID=A0AAE1A619_9GAST|nr:hypothetical protein RRG08_029305 [Elysia crispata]
MPIQEIKEIAEELQLRGDEKKNFIIEQIDKLRKLQAEKEQREEKEEREAKFRAENEEREAKLRVEKEEREAKLRAEKEEREAKLRAEKEEREAKLQAEKEEREAKVQAEERLKMEELRTQAEERLKMEELMRTQLELAKIQAQAKNEATDYDRVKEVLQKRYNLTEDGYRQRFRTYSPEEGENPSMFIVRLKRYLERWMKLAEAPQTYEALRDLFVKEQFLDSSPADLST